MIPTIVLSPTDKEVKFHCETQGHGFYYHYCFSFVITVPGSYLGSVCPMCRPQTVQIGLFACVSLRVLCLHTWVLGHGPLDGLESHINLLLPELVSVTGVDWHI